jgi:hypothetical protein
LGKSLWYNENLFSWYFLYISGMPKIFLFNRY